MKIWIKYLIGSVLGIIIAAISSSDSAFFNAAVDFAANIAIQFGRYSLYPVLFFGFTVSISKLRESRSLLKLSIYIAVFIILSSLLAALLGLISISISSPPRIPIFVEDGSSRQVHLKPLWMGFIYFRFVSLPALQEELVLSIKIFPNLFLPFLIPYQEFLMPLWLFL